MAVENGKPGVSRWRRLSAAAGVAALIGVGSVLAAAPASAASANVCGSYHSWSMCVTYEGGGEYYMSIGNGYGVSETEQLWVGVNGTRYGTQPLSVPPGQSSVTFYNLPAPGTVTGWIDNVLIAH